MLSCRSCPGAAGTPLRFAPPDFDAIPDTPLGDMIRFGRDVFLYTQRYAKPFVGNKLNCVNCHLDGGRLANSAPLWAAYVAYPAFRTKNKQVNTFRATARGLFPFFDERTHAACRQRGRRRSGQLFVLAGDRRTRGRAACGPWLPEVPQPDLARQAQHGASVSIERIAPPVISLTGPDSRRRRLHVSAGMGSRVLQQGRRDAPEQHGGRVHQGQHAAGARVER